MNDSFFTPKGLKIRLNALFFIQELSNNNNMNEQSVSAIPTAVEILWQIPAALKYFFTIICLLLVPEVTIVNYCIIVSLLTLFGCVRRLIPPTSVIGLLFKLVGAVYSYIAFIWFIPYLSIAIVAIFMDNVNLAIAFAVVSVVIDLVNIIVNYFILNATKKKYGVCFNDTEVCAFAALYEYLEQKGGLDAFIKRYCTYNNSIGIDI